MINAADAGLARRREGHDFRVITPEPSRSEPPASPECAGTVASCDSDDPLERLIAMGVAYVRYAVERPALFRLLFRPQLWAADVPDGHPARLAGQSAYQVLLDESTAACANGLVDVPVEVAVLSAWSIVHGLAMLIIDGPLEGQFTEPPDVLAEMVSRALARGAGSPGSPAGVGEGAADPQ